MKVLLASKAHVVGAYGRKLEELAALPDLELVAVAPDRWVEPGVGVRQLERQFTRGYRLEVLPLARNGHFHTFWFRGLTELIRREQPDVVHADEEAFNLATFLAVRAAVRVGARACFYNWANIDRRYPPPFGWFERYVFRHASHAIAGNRDAATIIQRHGYAGPVAVLPQVGVDPAIFAPPSQPPSQPPFVVGFVGRLVESKGVRDLLAALERLPGHVHLRLIGQGALEPEVRRLASGPLAGRLDLVPWAASDQVPELLRGLHALALPSRTTPRWKEQFGRVLVEAMSCGVPPVGSDSGEIPHVVGDAGLIFPEGDVAALAERLGRLAADPALAGELSRRSRQRVLDHYTQASLASAYAAIYRAMLAGPALA